MSCCGDCKNMRQLVCIGNKEVFSFKKLNPHTFHGFKCIFLSTMYIDHPNGNYGLYGLNTFACESIIRFKGEILKFHAFVPGTGGKHAIYLNDAGEEVLIDLYDGSLNITRMMWIND